MKYFLVKNVSINVVVQAHYFVFIPFIFMINAWISFTNSFQLVLHRPKSLQSGFIIPNRLLARENFPIGEEILEVTRSGQESLSNEYMSQIKEASTTFDDVVCITISYDIGRSTGRNYDSLHGFGAIIGSMSGIVLDYNS